MLIKNYDALTTSKERSIVLKLINSALESIQPDHIIRKNVSLVGDILKVMDESFSLGNYERIFLVGFGKGSSEISKLIGNILKDKLTQGYVIDVVKENCPNINFTQGTHPLPTRVNIEFTQNVIDLSETLTPNDLIIIISCGGGSSLFEVPAKVSLEKKIEVDSLLIKSGADIHEINTVRKHLSKVKGGGLAKFLYPSQVLNLVFSDVPGNDLSVIASGPLVKDETVIDDAMNVMQKYGIENHLSKSDLIETPKDEKYFKNVSNILVLSNRTALDAMSKEAEKIGIKSRIFSDKIEGDAFDVAKELIGESKKGEILLSAGESTVHVKGSGKGGRNMTLVLHSLSFIDEKTIISSFDSDGWDFTTFAGAIGDRETIRKAKEKNLDIQKFLDENNSLVFFEKVNGGIDTGKLPSNVSDLMIVFKY